MAASKRIEYTSELKDVAPSAQIDGRYLRRVGGLVVGETGSAGSDATFTHIQDVAASVWTIDHDLGKRPSVTVTDTAGTTVSGRVEYPTDTRVIVRFSVPFSGRADLN